jgi:23S rRNA pseudouridine1911/1915/1917 synthase
MLLVIILTLAKSLSHIKINRVNQIEEDFIEEQDNDELYEHHRVVADKGQEPLRIDKFLMNRIENATRTKL